MGIIPNSRMAEAGLAGHEGKVFAANALAHLLATGAAYTVWRWRRPATSEMAVAAATPAEPLDFRQRLPFVVIAAWALGAVILRLPGGLSALAAVVVLLVCHAAAGPRKRVSLRGSTQWVPRSRR